MRPSVWNICWSASLSLFGVVNNFSPVKIEFAPAMKHNAFTKVTQGPHTRSMSSINSNIDAVQITKLSCG
jgi:hypothetical protein